MIDVDKTCAVLEQIALSKDPVGLMRELVLDGGGTWIDTATVDTARGGPVCSTTLQPV